MPYPIHWPKTKIMIASPNVLNNLLHKQAKGFLKRYKGHPETLSEMFLDNIVASIHPVFLSQLTQSKRQ